MENKMKYIVIAIVAIILVFGGISILLGMASAPSGDPTINDAFGQLQEGNKYMVYFTLKNVGVTQQELEQGKYKVNVEYYAGSNLLSTQEPNWMESIDNEFMADTKYISTEKIDKAVIKLTDESGTVIQTKDVQFEDTTSTTDTTTDDSKSPEEKFIEKYDTNGDNLLDSSEFPSSKFSEINNHDISKGLDPYSSIQMLIEDFDINLDHKLSADEIANISNLNL